MEMATEYRWITKYEDIPPVVRGAILAAEDKNFFSHNGVDYSCIPRVLGKLKLKSLLGRLTKLGGRDAVNSSPIFPQGGSTITQQLVRGYFLQAVTAREKSNQLRHSGLLPRGLSYLIGARSVNMVVRKVEEIRLALWLEKELRARFGSKQRAKEEILARYVSLVYMGNGQYGLSRAADYFQFLLNLGFPHVPYLPRNHHCTDASRNTRPRFNLTAGAGEFLVRRTI